MNPSEKTQSAALKLLENEAVRKGTVGCFHLRSGWSRPRATSPRKSWRCLRLAGKTLGGLKKTTWRLSCWKLNRSEKTQSAAFKLLENEPVRQDTVGCFHLARLIQPVCRVATEILEVLASGGKNFRRSTTWRLSCWKLNRSEKTQSAACFKLLENEPVRQDTVGCFHLARLIQPVCRVATEILEVLASGGKNFWRSRQNHLEAKLLENEPTWRLSCWYLV